MNYKHAIKTMNFFDLEDKRKEYLLKITSPLDIKINVYIDGNNLFRNLSDEIEDILEIYKLAADTYFLKREGEMDEYEKYEEYMTGYEDEPGFKNVDYSNTPEKLANLASWYVKNSLPAAIIRNVKTSNARNLVGELDLNNNEILFPKEAWSEITYPGGERLEDLKLNSLSRHIDYDSQNIKKFSPKTFEVIKKILNSIDEYKNIQFKDFQSLNKFFQNNKKVSDAYTKQLEKWGIDKFKNKVLLNFKFKYFLYRAKINTDKYISICQNRIKIPNLSPTQKNFYKENIELLKKNKFKPNINKKFIININDIDSYYSKLKSDLSAEVTYGFCSWNSFKISEKEVDSRINLDIHKAMITNKADLYCLLTNDSDFAPIFEEAKKLKRELYLCSVVPKKIIAKRLKNIIPDKNIFSVKNLEFESMHYKILGVLPPIDFKEFITNDRFREKTYEKIYQKMMEKQYYLNEIMNNFKKLNNRIKFLFTERFD